MAMQMKVTRNVSIGGKQFQQSKTVTADAAIIREVTLPAAKAGTLSTRTDANTGTLTLGSGHGVTTGARLDLYWVGGSRRGIVVGTVAGTSVPIDLGDGDDLPTATTEITAMVPQSEACIVAGDDVEGLAVYGTGRSTFVFALTDDSESYARVIEALGTDNWRNGDGDANPLAGDAITQVFLSHGEITEKTLRFAVLYN